MFRHILVPLDGSTRAEQALSVAARLARASHGSITLLQVVDLAHDTIVYGMAAPYVAQGVLETGVTSARNYLEQLRQYKYLEGIPIQTEVIEGNPAATIIAQAARPPIDLIVISSHGYTRVKRWLLGSVAEKIAHHSQVPVFILRDREPLHIHRYFSGDSFVRALVPLDTSPRSQDVLVPVAELVAALSTAGQGELHLAQMVVPPDKMGESEKEALREAADQNLAAIAQSIREGLVARFGPELHPTLSWSVSVTDDVAAGIVLLAENGKEDTGTGPVPSSDLIALTTHGAGGLHRWPIGGIAERVLHSTSLPMLIVRPEDMIVKERHHQKDHAEATV